MNRVQDREHPGTFRISISATRPDWVAEYYYSRIREHIRSKRKIIVGLSREEVEELLTEIIHYGERENFQVSPVESNGNVHEVWFNGDGVRVMMVEEG